MKKYTFEIILEEECDEFFEDLNSSGYCGADDVQKILEIDICPTWPNAIIRLKKFEDK
jgi:hypothetical protein